MSIRLYMYTKSTYALGPYKRFGIWTQGCIQHCVNCLSPDSQPMDGGFLVETKNLINAIIDANVEGVTISGGEPFLQAEELFKIVTEVKKRGSNIGVIIYTGYTFDELKQMPEENITYLLSVTDVIIDGRYVEELDDGKSLRGSSNQRIIPLSKRYMSSLELYGTKGRKIELFLDELGQSNFYGIPPKNYREVIKSK